MALFRTRLLPLWVMAGVILACPRFALAQPLFYMDHKWSFSIGETEVGLRQVRYEPDERIETFVYAGSAYFTTGLRAWQFVGIAILSLVAVAIAVVVTCQVIRTLKAKSG